MGSLPGRGSSGGSRAKFPSAEEPTLWCCVCPDIAGRYPDRDAPGWTDCCTTGVVNFGPILQPATALRRERSTMAWRVLETQLVHTHLVGVDPAEYSGCSVAPVFALFDRQARCRLRPRSRSFTTGRCNDLLPLCASSNNAPRQAIPSTVSTRSWEPSENCPAIGQLLRR